MNKAENNTEIYKVDWIGKNPNYLFSKVFDSKDVALKLGDSNPDAVVYKLIKGSNDVFKWQIIANKQGKEIIRSAKLRRESNGGTFINADGVSEVKTNTLSEFQKSQNVRLISILFASPLMIYAGTQKELPQWLRYSLIGLGSMTALVNGRNYLANRK